MISKIALLGNMNNNNFSFLRYLKDFGYNVKLLLYDNEPAIFNIENDVFDKEIKYSIIKLKWGSPKSLFFVKKKNITRDLKDFNFIIGTGLAPAFLYKAKIKLDVFIPYGADIDYFTKFNLTYPNKIFYNFFTTVYQRKGLKNLNICHMEKYSQNIEKKRIKFLKYKKRWEFPFPLIYHPEYCSKNLETNILKNKYLKKFIDDSEQINVKILYPVRHVWGGAKEDLNQKGTENLFEGIKIFRNHYPNISIKLVTFKYGDSIKNSIKLADQLLIRDNIEFLEEMPRKDIITLMSKFDIVCGEFYHSWVSASVYFEAIISKTMLMCFRDDKDFEERKNLLYPIINAKNPKEISKKIYEYYCNKDKYKKNIEIAYNWYLNEVVKRSKDLYLKEFDKNKLSGQELI